MAQFPQLKVIRLGTHKTRDELLQAGTDDGNEICGGMDNTETLSFNIATAPANLELLYATVEELGFSSDGATWQEILVKLNELGFGKCPEEAAVQLWRQYTDQPDGGQVCVVTDPLIEVEHLQKLVMVVMCNKGKRYLTGKPGDADYVVPGHVVLVFCRKKKS